MAEEWSNGRRLRWVPWWCSPSDVPISFMRTRWSFSLILLTGYLGVFHLWNVLPRGGIVFTALVVVGLLGVLFVRAARRGYFVNRWDAFWHASVLVDVAAEGLAVSWHSGHSFYLCALAFVLVVGGYRASRLASRSAPRPVAQG